MTDDEKRGKKMDAEDVKEILTVVADKVPAVLNSLADVLYGKEQSGKYGQAVAGFYKTLKDSGMTDEQAYELTKQYMSAMNLPAVIGEAIRGKSRRRVDVKLDETDDDDES